MNIHTHTGTTYTPICHKTTVTKKKSLFPSKPNGKQKMKSYLIIEERFCGENGRTQNYLLKGNNCPDNHYKQFGVLILKKLPDWGCLSKWLPVSLSPCSRWHRKESAT